MKMRRIVNGFIDLKLGDFGIIGKKVYPPFLVLE